MTRSFNTPIHCPRCGLNHTAESDFQRWYRNNSSLDSADGHVLSDLDFIVHRYMTPDWGRMIQCIMFIEVKTNGADISISQAKTLSIYRQLRQNQRGETAQEVMDGPKGGKIQVRDFGGFLLRLSHTDPINSQWIEWNRKRISIVRLVEILRFDVSPFDFKKTDWRPNHHHPDETMPLFRGGAA